MITFDKVTKIYPGDFTGLEKVDLHIGKGELVSIVGHSGAGKSTLLKLVYAEEQPTEGEVKFEKTLVNDIKRRQLPYFRRNFGMVFQDFRLLPRKTVFENVSYALEVVGFSNREILENVPQILDIVGMINKMDKYPRQLSGGEQQKIAIARALVHKPLTILADEPTGNLDPISSWEVIQLLLKINDFGTTVLLATHNKGIVDKIGRRVVTIEKGKVIRDHKKGKYAI